jgi:Trp operon repressor
MEHLSSDMEQHNQHQEQQQIQWRRDKVQELCSKGYRQREVSQVLQVGLATVNRGITYLRNETRRGNWQDYNKSSILNLTNFKLSQ